MDQPNFSFRCSLCPFMSNSLDSFQKHYVRVHKNQPGFIVACNVGACCYTTKTWGSYKMHMYRQHSNIVHADVESDIDENKQQGQYHLPEENEFDAHSINASFTLALEAEHNLSQKAIDHIVSTADTLVQGHTDLFRSQLKRKLEEMGIDPSICDSTSTQTFLEELNTNAKRQKKYSESLNTHVLPEAVCLGEKFVTKNGQVESVASMGYYVPLKKNLTALLSMPEVWHFVQNPHHSREDSCFMFDICDGSLVRNHPLLSADKKALQIILNCDDMEVVNPLGTHVKKHKVTVIYFILGNIPPAFRSKLHAIQLVAIGKTLDVRKEGAVIRLLADFVKTINELSVGFDLTLFGMTHHIRGSLVLVSADTLAANWLGGFKEGVAFALKNCRVCDLENNKLSVVFTENVARRSLAVHRERCLQLSGLTKRTRVYWSKLWGINCESCLLHVADFDLISGLVQDPMHILLEGVALHDLKHTLNHLIYVQKYFSLDYLNSNIRGFKYSYLHVHAKPAVVEKNQITSDRGGLKQTASGMLTLLQTLPLMLGHKITDGDRNWINFLRLVQITNFCTSTYCAEETCTYLKIIIAVYLHNFQTLYPRASVIPKMHYMVHFPTQMKLFGPLRHQWCMRFEGKNGFFANKRYKNFKNLPLTLAKRHQIHLAYKQSGANAGRNSNYLYEGDIVSGGPSVKFSELYPQLLNKKQEMLPEAGDDVCMNTSVTIHGKEYRKGCALVLMYNEDVPEFALLESVIVIDHVKLFVLKMMKAEFQLSILSYVLQPTQMDLIPYPSLQFKWPLSVYKYKDKDVVMNSNSHTYAYPF